MIIIPEIILLNSLKLALNYIRVDFNNNTLDETKSLLYRVLNGNSIQRYDLYQQAKAVFLAKADDPRLLDVNLFFNAKRSNLPTIHITLQGESSTHNSLGIGEGFYDGIFNDDIGDNSISDSDSDGGDEVESTTYTKMYMRRFKSQYNLVVTSDNSNEVVLIYNFIRSLTISLFNHLNLSGLENINLGGREIQINSEIIPSGIFIKTISLDFEYNVEAYDLNNIDILSEINLNQTIII